MLFFETGIGLEPKYPVSKQAYSCSSCHVPERGFTAGNGSRALRMELLGSAPVVKKKEKPVLRWK